MVIMILIIKIKTIIICNEICLKYVQTVSGVPAPKHLGYYDTDDKNLNKLLLFKKNVQ